MKSTIEINSKVRLREPVIEVAGSLFRFMLGSKVKVTLTAGKSTLIREITLANTQGFSVKLDRRGLPNGPYAVEVEALDAFGKTHVIKTDGVLRGDGQVTVNRFFERNGELVFDLKTRNLPNKIQPIKVVMVDRHKNRFKKTVYHNPFLDGELVLPKPDELKGLTTIVFSIMDWRRSAIHTEVKATM